LREMGASTRRTQKENTRASIVEAAYGEFCGRGILATRTEDVARAAGVSHGTVFLHFGSQEALVSAVIGEYCGRVAEKTHELAEGGSTVREVLSAHLEGIREYEPFYTRLTAEARLLPEACGSEWIGVQSAISFHLSRTAEKEMAAGRIKRVPLHLLFNTWIGLLHYYLINGDLFAPEGSVISRYGNELLNHFMDLITAENNSKEENHEDVHSVRHADAAEERLRDGR
jgi:AcrR family transcriptional regulator